MRNVSNPIIIDQNYCDQKEPCHQQVINQLIIPNIFSFFAALIYYVYIISINTKLSRYFVIITYIYIIQASAVEISNIKYINIKGTSNSKVAVKLECSKSVPCKGVSLHNVGFEREGDSDLVEASCQNVKLNRIASVFPKCS